MHLADEAGRIAKAAVGLVEKLHILHAEHRQGRSRFLAADRRSVRAKATGAGAVGDKDDLDRAPLLPEQRQRAAAAEDFVVRMGRENQYSSSLNRSQQRRKRAQPQSGYPGLLPLGDKLLHKRP